ncbi:MAG TPA: YihY/virulence factor BrkB family protein [Phycisphaerales bacterium]|nr:YihY/virulence factor BrkB family protein [Phycisphaerales bacterium]
MPSIGPKPGGRRPPPEPSAFSKGLGFLDRLAQRLTERGERARRLFHMGHLLVVNIRRTQLTRMAAALSYRTIFGLIPVLVVGLLLLAIFASRDQLKDTMTNLLHFTGFDRVVVTAPEPGPPPDPDMVGPSPTEAQRAAAELRLDTWIADRYESIRSLPSGAIGIIGFVTLLYAAISMLIEIEKAFNQIYNAPEGRSWIRRVTQYWTLLTLGMGLLALSFVVQQKLLALAAIDSGVPGLTADDIKRAVGFVLTVLISTTALFIIYMIVPNTRVHPLPAFVGAATAAVLWESGKWAFTAYLSFSTGYAKIYGVIAILPLFFLWIYITWLIVLLGLQLASALQTQRLTNAEGFKFSLLATFGLVDEDAVAHRVKIVDPAAVLVVVTAVAERFATGKTSDHAAIAEKTGIDEQAVAEMLDRLAGAGLLVRVADTEREGSYTLARPPEALPAATVLAVARELVSVRTSHTPLLDTLEECRISAMQGKSVADLMQKPTPDQMTPITKAIGV